MLKLTEHVGITISLLYKQKTRWNSDIQNLYSEILNFRLFYAKNRNLAQFSGPAYLYDVITTQRLDRLYSFWYVWIEKVHTYLLMPKSIS